MRRFVKCISSKDYEGEHKAHKYVPTKKVEITLTATVQTVEKTPYIMVWGRKIYVTKEEIAIHHLNVLYD